MAFAVMAVGQMGVAATEVGLQLVVVIAVCCVFTGCGQGGFLHVSRLRGSVSNAFRPLFCRFLWDYHQTVWDNTPCVQRGTKRFLWR